jgi:hypothetical protein
MKFSNILDHNRVDRDVVSKMNWFISNADNVVHEKLIKWVLLIFYFWKALSNLQICAMAGYDIIGQVD